jgi:hypothetical protein
MQLNHIKRTSGHTPGNGSDYTPSNGSGYTPSQSINPNAILASQIKIKGKQAPHIKPGLMAGSTVIPVYRTQRTVLRPSNVLTDWNQSSHFVCHTATI